MTLLLQSILAGLTNGFVYGLIGLGIAVVFRGARIINAMQGDFALLGSVVAYVALTRFHLPMLPAFLVGVIAGGVLGFLVERLLIRPLRSALEQKTAIFWLRLAELLQPLQRCCSISAATRTY